MWSTGTENWYCEVVWKPGSLHGVPWRARVETWQLPWSPMDGAVGILDILMEYHEKSELRGIVTPAECCWEYPWICGASVLRPTVDVNLSSGHRKSAKTRLVLISCVSDHARCMAQFQV